jgi:hypothetical protein
VLMQVMCLWRRWQVPFSSHEPMLPCVDVAVKGRSRRGCQDPRCCTVDAQSTARSRGIIVEYRCVVQVLAWQNTRTMHGLTRTGADTSPYSLIVAMFCFESLRWLMPQCEHHKLIDLLHMR